MALLSTSGLGLAFGADDIFRGITLSIARGEKIGLVGPNGIGKSSLLKVLAGYIEPDEGEIHTARDTRIGYLRQEAERVLGGRTHALYTEMLAVFEPLREQERRLAALERELALGDPDAELLARYDRERERFELAGGYTYEQRIRRVLEGLGFEEERWAQPVAQLSGGQKSRALLARLLLEAPDLMVMDEPTNHLDVAALEWLETTLAAWDGALLVVSHDRFFLDRVVDVIWEMGPVGIERYRGNYSAYVQQREERWRRGELLYRSEIERLERELDYIRRHIAGQNTDIAAGKLKRLSREILAIESFGIGGAVGQSWSEMGIGRTRPFSVAEAAERIAAIRAPVRPPRIRMRLSPPPRSGDRVLSSRGLTVGYDDAALFDVPDLELQRGERVALIGPNGSGKSTFLATLVGDLEPLEGELRSGTGVRVGFLRQSQQDLDPDARLLDEFMRRSGMLLADARNFLALYLFRGDEIEKRVGSLSGGERVRLALAILAREGANFLLLDEPTNHLDIPTQEVLEDALTGFDGTILLVSHDRYLVDRIASRVWWIDDGRLHDFSGGYREHIAALARRADRVDSEPEPVADSSRRERPRLSNNERRRREERVARLEREIHDAEARLARLEPAIQAATEAQDVDRIRATTQDYERTRARLDHLLREWEERSSELAALLADQE